MVGNKSNFDRLDVLRCFFLIKDKISRAELAKQLGLGEGTVRSLLDSLKSKKIITSTRKGHFYTHEGRKLFDAVTSMISMPEKIDSKKLYPEHMKVGIIIKKHDNPQVNTFLRDIAVLKGALGAIILRFDKKLLIPDSGFQNDFSYLEKEFDLNKGDLLVVCFAADYRHAELGALAITQSINKDVFIC